MGSAEKTGRGNRSFDGVLAVVVAVAAAVAAGACKPDVLNPRLADDPKELRLFLPIEQFQLDNGMRVAILPEKTTNLVQVDVRYQVGSTADPIGREGLAHVVEHLQYTKRATDYPDALIGEIQTDISLSHNAYTTLEYTHYTATALSSQTEALLRLERDRLATGCDSISDEAIKREISVVHEELRQRGIAAHDSAAELRSMFYGKKHAYARAPGGSEASVAAIDRGDVCAFLARHYGPANAILIVNGNVTRLEVITLIGALFNPIPGRPLASSPKAASFKRDSRVRKGIITGSRPVLLAAYTRPSWHSNSGVVARIIDRDVTTKLATLERTTEWIHDVGIGHLGGDEAPIAVIYIEVESESRFDEARKRLEKAVETPVVLRRSAIKGFKRAALTNLLRSFEPFGLRAQRVADDIQFAEHQQFIVRDLGVLHHLNWTVLMALGGELFSDPTYAELRGVEDDHAESVSTKDIRAAGARPEFDLESWRRPVDPGEANRPLTMPPAPPAPKIRRATLENGVRLVLVPSLSFPLVDIRVLISAGSAHEPDDKPGVARRAAELLQPSYRYNPGRRVGADLGKIARTGYLRNSEVGRDSTTLHIRGLSPHVRAFLWLLYYNLQNGKYDEDIVEFVRKLDGSDDDDSDDEGSSQFLTVLLGADHPFVRARKNTSKFGAGDLERFRAKHYKTESMTVIVTGDFDASDVATEAARLFSSIRGRGAGPPVRPPVVARGNTRPAYLGVVDDDADQLRVSLGLLVPAGFEPYARREVLAELLRSRLMALRSRLAATYGISVVPFTTRELGLLFATTLVNPDQSADVFAQILAELAAVAEGKDIAADFTRARRKVFENALAATVDSDQLADQIEFALTYGLELDYRRRRAKEVAALTLDQFRATLPSELPMSRIVVELQGKKRDITAAFAAAGIKAPRLRTKPKPEKPDKKADDKK